MGKYFGDKEEKKALNAAGLCNRRSHTHYLGRTISYLIGFVCCFLWGLLPFMRQPFAWGPFICMLVGVYFVVMFIRCLLALMKPEFGKLGKSVRVYYDGTVDTDVQAIFARIDRDMAENGKMFGKVWVGKEWILEMQAMCISSIRGIFTFSLLRGKMREYSICLVDDRQNIITVTLTHVKQCDELNDYLTGLLPRAATGNFKDYMAFVAKDKEEMEVFNREFLQLEEAEEKQECVFIGTDGIPTSLATSELIRQSINALQPDERIRLAACNPPDSEWGNCTCISCYRLDDEGQYALLACFCTEDDREAAFILRPVPTAGAHAVLLSYFEKLKVPDVTTWEDQTNLLYGQEPMEDYILYVDGHKYDHINFDDVMASFEDLKEGKCNAFLIRTPGWQNGYMEVTGTEDRYTVEVAGFDGKHEVRGFRTQTVYGGHVTYWLSEYYHQYKYPEIRSDWEDITAEVREKIKPNK